MASKNVFIMKTINGHFSMNYNFVWIEHSYLPNMVPDLYPSSTVIKRLWCTAFV